MRRITTLLVVLFVTLGARADWPSVEEQLAAERAPKGSALEALVRANQRPDLLTPDEAKDHLPYPLWLRALWRARHPGPPPRPGDPTKGYPLVLKEFHEWMRAHPDLVPAPETPGARGLAPLAFASGANVSLSGAGGGPRSESDVQIDGGDPRRVFAASNNIAGSGRQAQYASTDGGLTFSTAFLPLASGDAFHSDPAVAITPDGAAWSATLGLDGSAMNGRVRVYRSTDSGRSFALEATVSGAQTGADKEMLRADAAPASPFRGRLYAVWHDGEPVYFNRRTAGPGGTWLAEPLRLSGGELKGTGIGADLATNGRGDVFVLWPDTGSGQMFLARSTDGGESFGAPAAFARTHALFSVGVPAMARRRALIYVTAGAWSDAARDEVYAAWTDLSGAEGCRSPADEPGADPRSPCTTRIFFARSTDGGRTWGAPAPVNDAPGWSDQFHPALAVDAATGALGIAYLDTAADPARVAADVTFQSSGDGGATWTCPVRVTSAPTDETDGDANQFGDYGGLAGEAASFLPTWTDRRSGGDEQIFTAPVTRGPDAGPPAAGTAEAIAPNRIRVSWGPSDPPAPAYDVFRAEGSCGAPGPFVRVATGVAEPPFVDAAVSGGTAYAYVIASRDASGCDLAPRSACVSATATGACTLAPKPAGSVTVEGRDECALALSWPEAASPCGGAVAYDVYRSAWPAFVPGPENRVATRVAATRWRDASGLVAGTRTYYAVRAVDAASGSASAETIVGSGTPAGPLLPEAPFADAFETAPAGFDRDGWAPVIVEGGTGFVWSTRAAQSGTHSWFSPSAPTVSARALVSPPFVPSPGAELVFWHTYELESSAGQCWDGATLQVSEDGGATWGAVPAAAFREGGYGGTVAAGTENPLGGAPAWCGGALGAMTRVVADLSAWAAKPIRLRWIEGDDDSVAKAGWLVDSVSIEPVRLYGACPSAPPPCAHRPCLPVEVGSGPLGGGAPPGRR